MLGQKKRCRGFRCKLTRALALMALVIVGVSVAVFAGLETRSELHSRQRELLAVAQTAAAMIDMDAHERLWTPEDEFTPEARRMRKVLADLRHANSSARISDIYTMRWRYGRLEFVATSYAPGVQGIDFSSAPDPAPAPHLGDRYDEPTPEMIATLTKGQARAEADPNRDDWGTWLSAYAPLRDARGRVVGLVGVDMSVETVRIAAWPLVARGAWAGVLALVVACVVAWFIAGLVTRPIYRLVAAVNAVHNGHYDHLVELRTRDEFQVLGDAFNMMILGLRHYEQVKLAMMRHLSEEVATRVLARPQHVELGGERTDVAVLVADLRDFTASADRMEPDAVVATLNECFGVIVEVVLAHGGMLDKFLGDGLMAVFATPDAPVHNAEAAVACALDAHAALERLNEDRHGRGLPPLHLGIGITCGEVVAGQIGSPQRLEYTVVGSEVNRAHRLQGLAGPGETIINDAVAARLGDTLEVENRGRVALKGFAEPVPTYRVHACLDCAA